MTVKLLGTVLLLGSTLANALSLATAKEKNFIPRSLSPDNESRHQLRDVKPLASSNWNGGEVVGPRFESVTAEVIIPNITFPYGYNSSAYYASSVWVGIGGDQHTCDSGNWAKHGGLVQGGYYYLYDKEGDFGVFAFYEWFPNPPIFLDDTQGILTDIGDHVRMTVTQKDNTTGTFTWENLTQDKKFEVDLTAPVNGTLCTNHAEWIIETFMTPENPESYFPDFGELSFTNIEAVSEAGKAASLADGYIIAAQPNPNSERYLTSCEMVDVDGTTCKWLGYEGIFD